jgi:hypothetical protein
MRLPPDFSVLFEGYTGWKGQALDGSGLLDVRDGPPEGGRQCNLDAAAATFVPDYRREEIVEMARRLYQKATG